MPLVRISLLQGHPAAYIQAISDSVQAAMVDTLGINPQDRLQIIEELTTAHWIVSAPLMGVTHSDQAVLIHISLKAGRTVEIKKHLYQQLVEHLSITPGIPKTDILILLIDVPPENWSFGNGIAQLI